MTGDRVGHPTNAYHPHRNPDVVDAAEYYICAWPSAAGGYWWIDLAGELRRGW